MRLRHIFLVLGLALTWLSCGPKSHNAAVQYTCPMPEDSVFSDKPGRCPKCGMELVPVATTKPGADSAHATAGYTCPMHPAVHSNQPGNCPVCGMKLEKVRTGKEPLEISLDILLKPANQAVAANVPMVHMTSREEDLELEVPGNVEYDPRYAATISSRISGRITRMYVQYRFQKIATGQPLMELYSPDLVSAQNELLFLLRNDAQNQSLMEAARRKMLLLGMTQEQIQHIIRNGKAEQSVTIYSRHSGVLYENAGANFSSDVSATTPLSLKEGMYVQQGQSLFSILDPTHARIALQVFPQYEEMLRVGNRVRVQPAANPDQDFRASIAEIVPFYQMQSKSLTARIPFDNTQLQLPIGSAVKATVFTGNKDANWLPEEAVYSLGMDKVVFVREQDGFVAKKVKTGIVSKHLVQILEGLKPEEAVAANAGFLVDSESFIIAKK